LTFGSMISEYGADYKRRRHTKRLLLNLGLAGSLALSMAVIHGVVIAQAAGTTSATVSSDTDPNHGNACHKTHQDDHGPKKCRVG